MDEGQVKTIDDLARTFDVGQLMWLQSEAEVHWQLVKKTYEDLGMEEFLHYPPWPTIMEERND